MRSVLSLSLLLMLSLGGYAAAQSPYHAASVAPFVPSKAAVVDQMLDLGKVGPGDYHIDLGSGNGRLVIAAAQRGALAHGVEINGPLVEQSRAAAREAGVADQTVFLHQDIFETDFSQATVVTIYLMPEGNARLRPLLLERLRPGSRVVSNTFGMREWEPDEHITGQAGSGLFLWVIPAQVAGRWEFEVDERSWELQLRQHFQQLTPALQRDGKTLRADRTLLRGRNLQLITTVDGVRHAFHGEAQGDQIEGFVQISSEGEERVERWRAHRVAR